ncbi:hypothetical protein [Thermanaerothrix sp.]|uniref:hypothetical protein n=1 Tax=Thermanaerothrix sp. TaxID=2972675 RepID=UPI002ADDB137|nr:hypothetical protein [Thermanaerothrix sp.]
MRNKLFAANSNGLFVVVLGSDGTIKRMLIQNLQRELRGTFKDIVYFHFMPRLLRRGGEGKPVTNPHGKPPRSCFLSILKLIYYWLDFNLGYLFKVRPALKKSALVLFDRYFDDLLIDPKRYRYGGPMALASLLQRFTPRPSMWLLLDVPEEVIFQRKQEVSLREINRQRKTYRQLAFELPNAVLLDATLSVAETTAQAQDAILSYLKAHASTHQRFGFGKLERNALEYLDLSLGAKSEQDGQPFYYLGLPNGRGFLLPATTPKIAAAGLTIYTPQKKRTKLTKSFLKSCIYLGIANLILPRYHLNITALYKELQNVFKKDNISLSVSLGFFGPHRKPVIMVMDERGNALGYVKVGWNEPSRRLVENEVHAIQELAKFKTPKLILPQIAAFRPSGKWYLLCTYPQIIQSGEMLSQDDISIYVSVLCSLAKAQTMSCSFINSEYWQTIYQRLEILLKGDLVPLYQKTTIMRMVSCLERNLSTTILPWVWKLGDFTIWNTGLDRNNGRVSVIDLEYARPNWLMGWDVFHFLNSIIAKRKEVDDQQTLLQQFFSEIGVTLDAQYFHLGYLLDLMTEWYMTWYESGEYPNSYSFREFNRLANQANKVMDRLSCL